MTPIYDNDGTTSYEIGKVYDNDGTTNYQIGKVYDFDGTAVKLIYTASVTITDLVENGWWVGKSADINSQITPYLTTYADAHVYKQFSIINGHKYYVHANGGTYGDSDGHQYFRIPALGLYAPHDGSNYFYNNSSNYGSYDSANIFTASATATAQIEVSTYNGGSYTKLYSADIVDLTASFGAGNEPTLSWCNSNLKNKTGTYEIEI